MPACVSDPQATPLSAHTSSCEYRPTILKELHAGVHTNAPRNVYTGKEYAKISAWGNWSEVRMGAGKNGINSLDQSMESHVIASLCHTMVLTLTLTATYRWR